MKMTEEWQRVQRRDMCQKRRAEIELEFQMAKTSKTDSDGIGTSKSFEAFDIPDGGDRSPNFFKKVTMLYMEAVKDSTGREKRRGLAADPPAHRRRWDMPTAGTPERDLQGRFRALRQIGEGTYGVVFKAIHVRDNVRCALKMISMDRDEEGIPSTCLREISCIKDLQHDNIVTLYDIIYSNQKLYMVFEFIDRDLKNLLEIVEPRGVLPPNYVKSFMWQLLSALSYCHLRRIVHRDLKPQNILVADSGVIKIADFGLARNFSFPSRNYTHEVVTLWYRPPEILLGSQRYSTSLDMWSLGCIFAEIASNKPLFPGECEISQLFKIFEMIGTPSEQNWPGVADLQHYKAVFPQWSFDLAKLEETSNLTGHGLDVLREIVRYPPERRLTAKGALSHRYFLQNGFTQNRPSVTDLLREIRNQSRASSSSQPSQKDDPVF